MPRRSRKSIYRPACSRIIVLIYTNNTRTLINKNQKVLPTWTRVFYISIQSSRCTNSQKSRDENVTVAVLLDCFDELQKFEKRKRAGYNVAR
uniref:Uncharacterized protein n=1 Tax=Trichogramma kaykai TaxID=54128 RepID=A0ABD2WIG8_9HYME